MDPFQKLPPEIRHQILLQTEARQELVNMSHASPAMFLQRVDHLSRTIHAHLRRMDFCDDLLQDAMAIVLFPKGSNDEEDGEENQCNRVHRHLKQWAAKGLPNPIPDFHICIMDKLDSLCLRLDNCIKDFLWKATSSHLRQAYIHLPEWAHPSWHANIRNLPPRPEHEVDLGSLSRGERQRILKAFLRYEILAKLIRPQPHGPHVRRVGKPMSSVPAWDWNVLDRYEGRSSEVWEIEGILCVFEYFRALYGAISARFDGIPAGLLESSAGWLSMMADDLEKSLPTLSYSDDMNSGLQASFFIKNSRGPLMLTWVGTVPPGRFIDMLALGGVDQAAHVLLSGKDYSERFFDHAAAKAAKTNMLWDLRGLGLLPRNWKRSWNETAILGPGAWRRPNLRELYTSHDRCWGPPGALFCTYRQRAWAFFDDERLYPDTCRFHTLQEVEWMCGEADEELHPEPRTEPEPPRRQESQQQIKEACENPDMWLLSPTAAYIKGKKS
ncbi:Uncharacterized protein TPAR_01647 [Tolypocladium paradoxum]|uniref:Uncharacterized protein n=1 Tax=Tolypocladium paradoxum TaxID=94208 RepID=A0A2S4L6X9_9HYPO|nr:Uncharacterized protein TPAR_01647 [Tolypocladium paradoxum]